IELTEAERERILRQGPKNLAAFLAYSRGLEDLDRGDYPGAARHFGAAAPADPSFQAAQQGQQAATAAPAVEQATGGGIVTVVDAVERVTGASEQGGGGGAGGLLVTGTRDVGPTVGELVGDVGLPTGASSIDRQRTPEALGLPSILSVTNGI